MIDRREVALRRAGTAKLEANDIETQHHRKWIIMPSSPMAPLHEGSWFQALLLAASVPLLVSACTYNWNVAPTPEDAGQSDVAADIETDIADDVAADVVLDNGTDSAGEADVDPNCAILLEAIAQKEHDLKQCDPSVGWPLNFCDAEYTDACGCTRKSQKPILAEEYTTLVQQAQQEGCEMPPCGSCPNPEWSWTCKPDGDWGSCQPSP